jgi:glycosyltransferase involved in cell wall biosynthesis
MKISKRVLVIATSSNTRGGITAVIKAHKKSNFWEEWNCIWIETHIDKSYLMKIFYFIKSFIKFLHFINKTSLIHCHLSGPISVIRKLPFLIIAKLVDIPIIIHFHAFSSKSNIPKNYIKFYSVVFDMAEKIIVLSENWKDGILKDFKYDTNKVKVIYNPCTNVLPKMTKECKKYILYAGTLNERKGYKDLIKAFSKIAYNYPDWKLVFAGNGEIEEGKTLAKKLNIYDQVIFKGWVIGDDKHKLFSQASIFCLPSYAEGFPMAVLDAWAYALPVVSTPVGGIPDVAIHGENMLLCEPGNINCLARNLKLLIDDDKMRKKLIKASIEFSTGKFSISSISKDWNRLYNNLLKI